MSSQIETRIFRGLSRNADPVTLGAETVKFVFVSTKSQSNNVISILGDGNKLFGGSKTRSLADTKIVEKLEQAGAKLVPLQNNWIYNGSGDHGGRGGLIHVNVGQAVFSPHKHNPEKTVAAFRDGTKLTINEPYAAVRGKVLPKASPAALVA